MSAEEKDLECSAKANFDEAIESMKAVLKSGINELCGHTYALFFALASTNPALAWCSTTGRDGRPCQDGVFEVGMELRGSPYELNTTSSPVYVVYIVPMKYWVLACITCKGIPPERVDFYTGRDSLYMLYEFALSNLARSHPDINTDIIISNIISSL